MIDSKDKQIPRKKLFFVNQMKQSALLWKSKTLRRFPPSLINYFSVITQKRNNSKPNNRTKLIKLPSTPLHPSVSSVHIPPPL